MLITKLYNNNNTNNTNILSNIKEEYDFCFICYEIQIENEIKPLKLYSQPYYIKSCYCDGFIHKSCLDKWHSLSETCPICREFIIHKKIFDLNVSYIYIIIVLIILKIILKIILIIIIILYTCLILYKK